MKSFFQDPNGFFVFVIFVFTIICFAGGITYDHIDKQQKFDAYQKALLTITQCRSATAGDVDKLCGTVPTPKDFGIGQ